MARERKQPEPDPGAPKYLTTYGDMVTLLMAFFVMLFAISSVDQQKFLALVQGLEADFGNTAYDDLIIDGGAGLLGTNQPAGSPIPVPGGTLTAEPLAAVRELALLAAFAEEADDSNARGKEPEDTGLILDYQQLLEVATRLQDVAVERSLTGAIQLGFNERGLVVVLSTDEVLFNSGSATLSPENAELILAPIAAELATFDNDIFIEGHTDDVPLNRDGYSNWDLSADRALAVLDYFELVAGLEPQRLVASGYGEYRPIADGATPVARQRNRRVELVIAFESAPDGPLQPLEPTDDTDDTDDTKPPGLAMEDDPVPPAPYGTDTIF
jgi:chemotaxis protein MotB